MDPEISAGIRHLWKNEGRVSKIWLTPSNAVMFTRLSDSLALDILVLE